MRHYRPMFYLWTINQVMVGFRVAMVAIIALGYWKIKYGYDNNNGAVQKERMVRSPRKCLNE